MAARGGRRGGTVLHFSVADFAMLADGTIAHMIEAEQRYVGLDAAVEAEPDLREAAAALQRVRAQLAAAEVGIELRGDGRPFPAEIVAAASRALRRRLIRPADQEAT
jgi:hypothetical protein